MNPDLNPASSHKVTNAWQRLCILAGLTAIVVYLLSPTWEVKCSLYQDSAVEVDTFEVRLERSWILAKPRYLDWLGNNTRSVPNLLSPRPFRDRMPVTDNYWMVCRAQGLHIPSMALSLAAIGVVAFFGVWLFRSPIL